jgi:hypothetical protein
MTAGIRNPSRIRKPRGYRHNVGCRRTAAARRQAETFLERPVFGVKRPFSDAWGIRDLRGGHISIERRRRTWSMSPYFVTATTRTPPAPAISPMSGLNGGDARAGLP